VATELPALLTVREVADLLRVHENTVYKWAKDGTLEALTLGKTVRFRRADVEALLSGERAG
jgi:excisionase family DNA binding protein